MGRRGGEERVPTLPPINDLPPISKGQVLARRPPGAPRLVEWGEKPTRVCCRNKSLLDSQELRCPELASPIQLRKFRVPASAPPMAQSLHFRWCSANAERGVPALPTASDHAKGRSHLTKVSPVPHTVLSTEGTGLRLALATKGISFVGKMVPTVPEEQPKFSFSSSHLS